MTQAILLLAVTAIGGAGWCVWAWYWPWTGCRRCEGRRGRGLGSTKHGYNRCRKCTRAGTPGEQVRHTARVISKATGLPVRGSKEQLKGK